MQYLYCTVSCTVSRGDRTVKILLFHQSDFSILLVAAMIPDDDDDDDDDDDNDGDSVAIVTLCLAIDLLTKREKGHQDRLRKSGEG